jgi:hypothetical protein
MALPVPTNDAAVAINSTIINIEGFLNMGYYPGCSIKDYSGQNQMYVLFEPTVRGESQYSKKRRKRI